MSRRQQCEQPAQTGSYIVFFATSQALATWAIVSGIKWPKQLILMEMRLTDKPES